MNPPREEPDPAELAWRLTALEKQVEEQRQHFDTRFDRLDANLGSLAYVRLDLYRSEQAAQDARIESLRGLSMWTMGLLITACITALVAGLVRLAVA